jgi:hypothetical protein
MTNAYRYDFDSESQLVVEMPMVAYDRAMRQTQLAGIIESDGGFVSEQNHLGGKLLTLNKAPFKNGRLSREDAEAGATHWLYALTSTRPFVPPGLVDKHLDVHMSQDSSGDLSGQYRLGFQADLKWPLADDETASRKATRVMREMALNFGYLKGAIIDSAYAGASNEQGVELQALDVGCCCVHTDGMVFDPLESKAKLVGHNLYNRQLVLTCLSGLVALARTR